MLARGIAIALPLAVSGALQYSRQDNFQGANFFPNFDFFTSGDPTHGFVNFLSEADALAQGLINNTATQIYMGADHTNVAKNGRNSVRITSKKAYNTGLFIIDLDHMPTGCGTWPAFWMVGPSWPNGGEIDIIEGIDLQSVVATTLHTSDGCSMAKESTNLFTGKWSTGENGQPTTNCYVNAPGQYGNQGCGIIGPDNSMGKPFNYANGGVYATEWTDTHIAMWFWPRGSVPSDVPANPDPTSWGTPYAYFTLGSDCPSSHFKNNNIVFDLTFCGDWDGAAFPGNCPGVGSCTDYVAANPAAFTEAYWSFNYVNTYAATQTLADWTELQEPR